MVAAGVGRAGLRVGEGVFVDNQGVQLAQEGHGGTSAAAHQLSTDSCQGQPGPKGDTQMGEFAGHQAGGFDLPKARLGVTQDGLGQADYFFGPGVDLRHYPALEVFFGGHGSTS